MDIKRQDTISTRYERADDIPAAFEALGVETNVPINVYLQNVGSVVVKNDPVLAEVFGQHAVDEYERLLAAAD